MDESQHVQSYLMISRLKCENLMPRYGECRNFLRHHVDDHVVMGFLHEVMITDVNEAHCSLIDDLTITIYI